MRVKHLMLRNLRGITEAEFTFKPGFNLLVGVNGAGKTTVLEALSVCLAQFLTKTSGTRIYARSFDDEDVRFGSHALHIQCAMEWQDQTYVYKRTQDNLGTAVDSRFEGRDPAKSKQQDRVSPLAIFFSTRRSIPSDRTPSVKASDGGVVAAYADIFSNRELVLKELVDWFKVQQALGQESPSARHLLASLEQATRSFLKGYQNLRLDASGMRLLIDKNQKTIPIRQLSDGERSTLILVFDITRRLALANPELANPTQEGEAVILIDEIDMHLHPQWQRQVPHSLTNTFPRCQFIATSHSPQIIGEIHTDHTLIMEDGEVYSPEHAYGVDASRILSEIMDTHPRTAGVQQLLDALAIHIGNDDLVKARKILEQMTEILGVNDPEVTRTQSLLEFMEDDI